MKIVLNLWHRGSRNFILNFIWKSFLSTGDNDPCGVVSCSNNKKCIVNKFGDAECICKDKCKKGDHYTGTVCGRDGIEYANLCKLKLSSCNGNKKKVKWFGKCKPEGKYCILGLSCMVSPKFLNICHKNQIWSRLKNFDLIFLKPHNESLSMTLDVWHVPWPQIPRMLGPRPHSGNGAARHKSTIISF